MSVTGEHPKKKRWTLKSRWTVLITILFAILFGLFVVRPSILGYNIYQAVGDSNYSLDDFGTKVRILEAQLLTAKTNLSLREEFTEQLMGQINEFSDTLAACFDEKGSLAAEIVSCEDQCDEDKRKIRDEINDEVIKTKQTLTNCTGSSSLKNQQIELLEEQLDFFAQNMAHSICCKERVDNPLISSYAVVNNRLVCLEEGDYELGC